MKHLIIYSCVLLLCSCGESFLDVNQSIRQRVPKSLADHISLLDNTTTMNVSSHALGMIGGDELFVSEQAYNAFPSGVNHNYQKRAYVWEAQVFEGNEAHLLDWNDGYKRILWANLVLEGIARLQIANDEREQAAWAKGTALFHRAFNYYNLAQLFCPVFEANTAEGALGLPLRLESDLTMKIPRSSLSETYQRILKDVNDALALLPEKPETIFRPGKAAALGLLARVYLQMGDYQRAFDNAAKCIEFQATLLDYNSLDASRPLPFTARGIGNPEIIFMSMLTGNMGSHLRLLTVQTMAMDAHLVSLYETGDLRRMLFYEEQNDGSFDYKGSYDASSQSSYFTGIATDEVYLILAESAVRLGNVPKALQTLNWLRKHRFLPQNFQPLDVSDGDILLDHIIAERQRQLVLRGTRWEDIRRLNKEERFAKALTRILGDRTYTLEPGSKSYVWPIPLEAVQVGGYEQNLR